ncbi:MAG: hypothetical protein M0R68_07310 [Bacteroidetes bacterium]|nr:hypothetical protein [Bacteroidota bacterium]
MNKFVWMLCIGVSFSTAQISIIAVEELPVPSIEQWNQPRFSPSSKEIFLTNAEYNGIWQYSLETGLVKEITRERHSGFDFAISEDGSKISYRTTVQEGDHITRLQEAIEVTIKNGNRTVWNRGNSIQTPKFIENEMTIPEKYQMESLPPATATRTTAILGVEENKIVILNQSSKQLIDPLGDGRYLWPVLSPDRTKLAAVDMERGAFISDLNGKNVVRLGKCNAPQWTRDGRWIIGMEDKDDGHVLIGSELIAVSIDGNVRILLTKTSSRHEMYPAVSPGENKIVATTSDGKVFVLTYEEVR